MTDLNQLNEHGVPLHACNEYRQDEHYWVWLKHRRLAWQLLHAATYSDYASWIAHKSLMENK